LPEEKGTKEVSSSGKTFSCIRDVTCFSFGQDTIVMLSWIVQGVDSVVE
jgi:hypothetical protein